MPMGGLNEEKIQRKKILVGEEVNLNEIPVNNKR